MKIAILPMDDRPVTYDYPRLLARIAGLEVLLPPREWLGNPWRSSRHSDLVKWLAEVAPKVDACIISIDTLAYGGLIPSRTSEETTTVVLQRLEILKELRRARPELLLLASSVVLRICRANCSEEEKPYWATYGSRMFRLSYLEHKSGLGDASVGEIAERDSHRSEIPDAVYQDYLSGRSRNHAVNSTMIDWLGDGLFDYLILPQDDTADYGWNIAEARKLQAKIRTRGLSDHAITYPGADEIISLLLARLVCRQAKLTPKVWPRYSGVTGPCVVTAYEDRPFHELLKAHLSPLGGTIAATPEEADFELHVNAPICRQGNGDSQWIIWNGVEEIRKKMPPQFHEWFDSFISTDGFKATRREMESSAHSPEEFVRAISRALAEGKRPIAVADVAFVNAADLQLGLILQKCPEIAGLAAYGAWNTAGNTLGTVLAQATLRSVALRSIPTPEQTCAQLEFLFLRLLDDDSYQAKERTRCMIEDLPAMGLAPTMERLPEEHLSAVEKSLRLHLTQAAADLRELFIRSRLVKDVSISCIHLPWKRLFEVGLEVNVTLP